MALIRTPAVRWGTGVVFVVLILVLLDPVEVFNAAGDARWSIVIPVVIGLAAVHSVSALAWWAMARSTTSSQFRITVALRLYYASLSLGLLTPSNIGSDIFRAKAIRAQTRNWRSAVHPIALQRATSFASLAALGIIGSLVLPIPGSVKLTAVGIVLLLVVAIAVYLWLSQAWTERIESIRNRLLPSIADKSDLQGRRAGQLLSIGVATGIAFHVISILLTLALVAAIDLNVSPFAAIAALTLIRMSIMVPLTVSGLGVQEGFAAIVFPAAGMPAETGVAISLLSRIGLLLTVAIGASLVLRSTTLELQRKDGATSQSDRKAA